MTLKKKLILASGSPRRRELLLQVELPHTVVLAGVEEASGAQSPDELVRDLSAQKCRAVAERLRESAVVLGADTVVSVDGQILGKPAEAEEAAAMLRRISGRTHEVYTGVTMIDRDLGGILRERSFSVRTGVRVAAMTEEEIRWYVNTQEPMDKAGAYGAQGPFARFIEGFDGDYCSVVGLPVAAVYRQLVDWELLG